MLPWLSLLLLLGLTQGGEGKLVKRGSRSEERDFQEEEEDKDSDRLDDDYNWEYNSGDYDRYQYGGHNGYNQYGDKDVGNETNDYHDGDLQWQHGVEERGESFWRSECRDWNAEEVYLTGDKVIYGGLYYKARWWNSATQPNPDATDDVWEVLGNSCDGIQVEAVVAEEDSDEDNNDEGDIEDGDKVDPHVPEDHEGPPTLQMAEAREAQLTDTPLFRLVKASIETLKSRKVDKVKAGRKANPKNVRRVERILSGKDWEFIFPMRDPAYSYARFLQAVAKFPSLCGTYTDGRDSDQICRRALATMFAHFTQETGGHNPHADEEEWRQGLVYLREAGCKEGGAGCKYDSSCSAETWQGRTWPCGAGQKYYGRGAKQLSYNFNYGPFSDAMTGNVDTLLQNPDLVAATWFNLASATWFYTYPQPPKPSMLHVIDGTWKPNKEDTARKLEPGFGATIMIINGGIECGHGYEKPQATNRQKYYKAFAKYLKVNIEGEELSCAHMKSFNKEGAGSLYIYWDREWTKEYECQLVKYQTPFNALKSGDYVRCVEDQFKVKLK